MGWLFDTAPRPLSAVHAELLDIRFWGEDRFEILAHASTKVGRRLWVAFRRKADGRTGVALFLLKKYEGCWGYKDIDETMGPVELDCPVKLLDLTEEHSDKTNEFASGWRARVRAMATEMKGLRKAWKDLAEGTVIEVCGLPNNPYTVFGHRKRTLLARNCFGTLYRLPMRSFTIATPTT